MSSKFSLIGQCIAELAALEHLKNHHKLVMGVKVVSTLEPSFLIGSLPLLLETRTCIEA